LQIIKKNESLWRHLWTTPEDLLTHDSVADLNLPGYKISSGDIRDIEALTEKFKALGVDAEAPVLVLTECVLVYLKPDEARMILSFVKDYFVGDRLFLNYEMIKPDDPFGKVMLENLEVSNLYIIFCRIADADSKGFMNAQMKPHRSRG
jgi:tRNA wybutosine-synthesizing protein 4